MVPCNDPVLEKKLLVPLFLFQENKSHAPSASIAKKADKRPKVFYLI